MNKPYTVRIKLHGPDGKKLSDMSYDLRDKDNKPMGEDAAEEAVAVLAVRVMTGNYYKELPQ